MKTVFALVSACLLGVNCRYNGIAGENPAVTAAVTASVGNIVFIPVCPEQLGGLATPREPCERLGERIVSKSGKDMTAAYQKGAAETLRLAKLFGCRYAVLKERSPSCGKGEIHDGRFSGKLVPGDGVCAEILEKNGIKVFGESEISNLIAEAEKG